MKKIFFILLLIAFVTFPADAQKSKRKRSRPVKPRVVYVPVPAEPQEFTKSYVIQQGSYLALPIPTSGDGVVRIMGRFEAQGGSGNDIEVYIKGEDDYINWKNGHASQSYYQSGRQTVGEFDVGVNGGTYYLILSNTFSTFTPKAVTLTIRQ